MTLRLLSSGVDSLYLSVNGGVRTALLVELEAAKVRAQHERGPVPFEFAGAGWRLLLKPGGHGGYAYWLTSPDVELWVGRNAELEGPRARVQFHSLYLHRVGPAAALAAVRELLEQAVCAGPVMLSVSRVDVYADTQGWRAEPADLRRFVARANHRELHVVGHRFTGFVFGRAGGMMARLYDKDAQMEEKGLTWMRAYWRGRVDGEPVWRLEFELRREFLRRLEAREPEAVLDRVPALWGYCTAEWMTLRTPSAHSAVKRWPVDPVWVEVQGTLGDVQEGRELVWIEAEAASELRVLTVLQGAFTSLAAMWDVDNLDRAARLAVGRLERYWSGRDRTFATEVARKRARLEARGVRHDGLDCGRGARLRHGGARWRTRDVRIVRPMMSNVIDRLERLMATAHELAVTTDEVTSVVLAALGLVLGPDAEQSVLDHLSDAFGVAGEDEPAVTETLRRIVEAVQERRRAAGLPPLLADDERVEAKPRGPEGSEPNRIHGRRAGGQDGAERRRRRVRDGGTARRGSGRTGRPLGGGPGLPKPKRGPGRRPGVSPDGKEGADSP